MTVTHGRVQRMSTRPLVSFVIVSWNVREYLIRCLESIERWVHMPHEIIVVDNASSDGTAGVLRKRFPQAQLVEMGRNVGFASANTQGVKSARGEWLFFLNPDTELTEDAVTPMLEHAAGRKEIGCLGPKLVFADGTYQPSVRRFPRLADQITILLKLRQALSWTSFMRRYLEDPGQSARDPIKVDQIMGAAMLIRREVYDQAGGFDERFPNWFEEVDLCQRIHRAGYQIVYFPETQLTHFGGRSFDQVLSVRKQGWWVRGIRRYAHRYWPWWQAIIIDILSPISRGLTLVQLLIKPR